MPHGIDYAASFAIGHWKDDLEALERHGLIARLFDAFLYDLALLLAGHDPDLDYPSVGLYLVGLPDDLSERLHDLVGSLLASGDAMRPNFGARGELRILKSGKQPYQYVLAYVVFEDHSVRATLDRREIALPYRALLVTMLAEIVEYHGLRSARIRDIDIRRLVFPP